MADAERGQGGSARTSDLQQRATTAAVMIAVAGAALWIGGFVWTVFVLIVGIGVWFEWRVLVLLFARPGARRTIWNAAGAIYCGLACGVLLVLRDPPAGRVLVLAILLVIIATDVGAYFVGRTLGGPRIAPAISPSKTWSGFAGGAILAAATMFAVLPATLRAAGVAAPAQIGLISVVLGAFTAAVAQAGDFFESWMKRRAGVKDSGGLLPGHGGLFDRVDGLLAVLALLGVALALVQAMGVPEMRTP